MAQATVTLSTITLNAAVTTDQRDWKLSSLTGLAKGTRLYVDQELVSVEQPATPVASVVIVKRGVDGTVSRPHANGATVTVGTGDQFYLQDPVGAPPNPIAVSPYINVLNGNQWGVQGDDLGPGAPGRSWALITTTPSAGDLGVRVNTTTSPS